MTESQATSKIIACLNEDGRFWKASDRFQAGIPDIIGVHHGRHCEIEMKIDYNKPTPLQVFNLLACIRNGGYAAVVTYNNRNKKWWIRARSFDGPV